MFVFGTKRKKGLPVSKSRFSKSYIKKVYTVCNINSSWDGAIVVEYHLSFKAKKNTT